MDVAVALKILKDSNDTDKFNQALDCVAKELNHRQKFINHLVRFIAGGNKCYPASFELIYREFEEEVKDESDTI